MATRFYFTSSATTPANSPGFAAWTRTTEGVRRIMSTNKDGTAMANKTAWANTSPAANGSALFVQFSSGELTPGIAFATTDTIKCVIRCLESAANDNINRTPLCLKVYNGTTLQATLKALGAYGPNTTEWNTALRNKQLADGDTLDTNYTTVAGDYLVLEVGGQVDATGGTSVTGTMSFGSSSASDLAENETGTAANNPWFEISRNLTFTLQDSFSSNWNVAAAVQDTQALAWNVAKAIQDTQALAWNVRAALQDTLASAWNVRAAVQDTFASSWNVFVAVGDSQDLAWSVRSAIQDSIDLAWNVRATVQDTFQSLWNVFTTLRDTQDFAWNVLGQVTAVGDQVDLAWNVRATVLDSVSSTWNVQQAINDVLTTSWNVRAAVADQLSSSWNVAALVQDVLDVAWHTRSIAANSLDMDWHVYTTVGALFQTQWHVLAVVRDELQSSWNVFSTVSDILQLAWNVVSAFNLPIEVEITVRYGHINISVSEHHVRIVDRVAGITIVGSEV